MIMQPKNQPCDSVEAHTYLPHQSALFLSSIASLDALHGGSFPPSQVEGSVKEGMDVVGTEVSGRMREEKGNHTKTTKKQLLK